MVIIYKEEISFYNTQVPHIIKALRDLSEAKVKSFEEYI